MLDKKNFDAAKQPLLAIQSAWAHDAVLKEQIGRAMSAVLVAEVLTYERQKEYGRLKQAARLLRTTYAGLYREEDIFVAYAGAMRQTGNWGPAGSLLNSEWSWEGKGKADVEPPAVDETGNSRGIRIKANRSIELSPVTARGATGASVELSVATSFSSYASGFKFDASAKDGRYRKLLLRDSGEVALVEVDGSAEKTIATGSIGRRPRPGDWIELSYVAEGGDIACFVQEKPVLLAAAPVPTDRTMGFWSSAEANFRLLRLRK